MLLTGENDPTDPIGQCQQFYRGLKRYGVDTEYVVYPREGHRIREGKHRIDLLKRILVWMFLFAGFLALAIALLTISYQSIKAATANPVDSLRCE